MIVIVILVIVMIVVVIIMIIIVTTTTTKADQGCYEVKGKIVQAVAASQLRRSR